MNRRQFGRVRPQPPHCRSPRARPAGRQIGGQLTNGEFNWFPDRSESGPIIAIVSLPDQRVYVYRNGVRIAASTCSTGKLGHRNPDRRVQDPAEGQEPPFLDLQQCADALHEPAHLVGHRAACGTIAGLPGVARMRAPAEGIRRTPVRRHQARHDGGHC